jgi:hypothetical protein
MPLECRRGRPFQEVFFRPQGRQFLGHRHIDELVERHTLGLSHCVTISAGDFFLRLRWAHLAPHLSFLLCPAGVEITATKRSPAVQRGGDTRYRLD